MDIAAWLQELGLAQYVAAFRDNDVDERVLRGLTAEDLRELGVTSVGHRRRLLQAVAALSATGHASLPAAERRRLTVMFVDLVGSTALSRLLDPEQLNEVIRTYQNAVAGEIARFDGHLAKFMGDGVLAYFGWPRVHEDEAQRAVGAGLAIAGAVGRLVSPLGEPLAARIGIATGPVVVGERVGEGSAQEQTVVGETPNLAARLQALAGAGEVVAAEATSRLLGRAFNLTPLEARPLHGFDAPVAAFRVDGMAAVEGRFEARQGAQLLPIVSRERELALLLEHWTAAKAGRGQAVLLVGEAGIGKSRLMRALLDAVAGEPHGRVRLQCAPQHTETVLWPAVEELGLAAVLDAGASLDARLDALESLLQADPPRVAAGPASPPPQPQPERALSSSPEARREETLQSLVARVLSLARTRPLLVVVEDAHWIDPSTLELLGRLVRAMGQARILLVVTSRPEREPDLPASGHLVRLSLSRLSRDAVAAIVARLGGLEPVPEALLDLVTARTDGIPLFVEELVKALLAEGRPLDGPLPDIAVPASLHDMLMARLDRLAEAKEVAQVAACIGREFELGLLASVLPMPSAALRTAVDRLCAAEIVLPHAVSSGGSLAFKHALLRDAAYESLLLSRRRALHERLLGALEHPPDGAAAVAADQLARHATAAEQWGKALHYWGEAGKAAMDRAAYREAIELLAKALEAGARLGRGVEVEVQMIDLRRALSWAAGTIGDLPRMMASLREAEAGAARLGLTRLKCELRTQRAHCESFFGGNVVNAIRYGRDALRMARATGQRELLAAARFALGQSHWLTGEYHAAIGELGEDVPAYRGGLRLSRVASGGTLAVSGLAILGGCHCLCGQLDEALGHGAEALELAEETGQPFDAVVAGYHLARTRLAMGELDTVLALTGQQVVIARRCGLFLLLPLSLGLHGHAQACLGQPDAGLETLDRTLEHCAAIRHQYARACALIYKARARLACGALAAAAAAAAEALALTEAWHYRALQADALRLLAEIGADRDEAAGRLAAARSIAGTLRLGPDLAAIELVARRLGLSC